MRAGNVIIETVEKDSPIKKKSRIKLIKRAQDGWKITGVENNIQ